MKRKLLAMLAAVCCITSTMSVQAAPETMSDGTVFDAEYYAENNLDVVKVYGTKKSSLYSHYVTYGRSEGRLPADAAVVSEDNVEQILNILVDKQAYSAEVSGSYEKNAKLKLFGSACTGNTQQYRNNSTEFYTSELRYANLEWKTEYADTIMSYLEDATTGEKIVGGYKYWDIIEGSYGDCTIQIKIYAIGSKEVTISVIY